MAKINKVYPAFFNGVTQQNPELALDSQCREMVNCVPNVVEGIQKRPPVKYVTHKDFTTNPELQDASVFHTYDRGEDDEEYIMLDVDSATDPIQVYNKKGELQIVEYNSDNATAIKSYLANRNLKGLTVQDRTWVFSKNAKVTVDTSETYPLQPDYDRVAYFWLKRGSGDRYNPFNYAVYLNNTTYAVDPEKPSNETSDPATGAEDSDVAAQLLADKINASTAVAYAGEISLSQTLAYKEFHIYIGTGKTGVSLNMPSTVDVSDSIYVSETGIFSFFARVDDYDPFGATLVEEFTINEDNATGFVAEVRGSILKIYKEDGSDFNFSSWDSWGNQASESWKGEVNKITDLPKDMPFTDVYVKILGDENNTFTDYFVHWSGSSWVETLDPKINRGKLTNMPVKMDRTAILYEDLNNCFVNASYPTHKYIPVLLKGETVPVWYDTTASYYEIVTEFIQNEAKLFLFDGVGYLYRSYADNPFNGNYYVSLYSSASAVDNQIATTAIDTVSIPEGRSVFTLNLVDWSEPRVGNLDNNPDPSFVDRSIQDLFFYKNRLGIASEDSVSLTETANYTNFYATTVVDIVDTDMIDITISTNQASKIYYAKPFNNSLYIFTKYAQYELVSEGVFSPSTVSLNNTTNYPMATDVEPVVVNDSLYFISTTNNRQQLREYIKSDNLNVTGIDLNVSTPTYLAKPVKKLITDGLLGYVLCCTNDNTVYLYNFKQDGTERVQSAWSKWELFQDYAEYGVSLTSLAISILRIITGSDSGTLDAFMAEVPAGKQYARGDISENGSIDISDNIMVLRHITGLEYHSKVDEIAAEWFALYESDPETYSQGINPLNITPNSFEYFFLGSQLLVMFKGLSDYRYHQLELDYKYSDGRVDESLDSEGVVTQYPYKASVLLPDYYPALGSVRTPLNKMLIKRVKIQGDGVFNADVFRKDYNKTYTKSNTISYTVPNPEYDAVTNPSVPETLTKTTGGSAKDLDLNIASKVDNVDITIYDNTADNFKITSVVVEGLFNTTSREMR